MPKPILIVDDDTAVLTMLYKVIKNNDLQAETAESGEKALELLAKKEFSLLLLDINLGGINGFEVIEQLRAKGNSIPIIIISGRREDSDTVYGLEIGADDYITKPLNPVTLAAKVKALLRRSSTGEPKELVAGPFVYNTSTLRLFRNGEEIPLSGKENAMMKLFLDNPNHIFSRDILYELVWGENVVDDNAIMVYINRLRQKIEDDPAKPKYICTVRGIGYRFAV